MITLLFGCFRYKRNTNHTNWHYICYYYRSNTNPNWFIYILHYYHNPIYRYLINLTEHDIHILFLRYSNWFVIIDKHCFDNEYVSFNIGTVHITLYEICLAGTGTTQTPTGTPPTPTGTPPTPTGTPPTPTGTPQTPTGTPQTPTGTTATTATSFTTTVICPLTEGMTNPQYINNATFVGAPPSTTVSQLTPGTPGVDFTSTNASVIIPFLPGVTPIVVSVSVPNTNTNVDNITVIITAPNGTVVVNEVSPNGTNTVINFPVTPLPENSTVTIIFHTSDDKPPENVTVSVIACYTPSTATTIVATGTTPPTVTNATTTLTISSTTTGVITGTGKII